MPINSSQLIQHRQLFDRLGANYSDLIDICNQKLTPTNCCMCNIKQSPLYSSNWRLQRDVDQCEYLCVDDTDREDRNASNLKIAIKNRI